MTIDWLIILMLFGSVHSLILGCIMFSRRHGKRIANRIFATILFVFAIAISVEAMVQVREFSAFPHLAQWSTPLIFTFAPLFYLYIRAFTESDFAFKRRYLLHFIPALAVLIVFLPTYLASLIKSESLQDTHRASDCLFCQILMWATIVQILPYLIIASRILLRYGSSINQNIQSVERKGCIWLRNLTFTVGFIWLTTLILHTINPGVDSEKIIWLLISLDIYLIGYMALLYPEVFSGNIGEFSSAEENGRQRKYERSSLTPDMAEMYLRKLQRLMNEQKPYLDSDINLPKLAAKLAMSGHHLSQIINDRLHQNFFEFINSHRIAEAKSRIAEPANHNLNLAEIGAEVGFNSISSFNAAFKKHTGLTPSQYRQQTTSATS